MTRRLRGDREVVASGHLTLDREKARLKLQKFRLPDPHMYVVQLVRAASVLGATKIEFTVEASTTTCVFDAAFEEFTVDEMWGAAFEERGGAQRGALHNLALAVASAQALNPAFIEVESGGTKLRIDVDDAEHERSDLDGTKITVKEKFRFGHLVEFLESQFGELPETRALERVCEFSLMEVTCNARPLNPVWLRLGPTTTEELDSGTVRVFASRSIDRTSTILLRDDVMVDRVDGGEVFLAAVVVLNSRDAPMDLTGLTLRERPSSFPRDPLSVYHAMLIEWLDRNATSVHQRRTQLVALLREVREIGLHQVGPGTEALLRRLCTDPMFDSALSNHDRPVPLRSQARDVIEYSTARFELVDGPKNIVHLPPHSDLIELLPRVGFAVRDRTQPLRREARRARNRARFEAQRPRKRPEPGPHGLLVRHGELSAVVEPILGNRPGHSKVLLDGRMLFSRESPLPYRIEVNGPLRPNEHFDNIERDDDFDQLTLLIFAAARRLFDTFADHEQRATFIMDCLARGTFNSDLLGMLGFGYREADKFLARHRPPQDVADDYRWLLREAGALADAKVFEGTMGSSYSLREIIESYEPPLFASVKSARAERMAETRPVLNLTRMQRSLVELVSTDVKDINEALRREAAENSLMRRPVFKPPRKPSSLHRHVVEAERFTLELELLPGGQAARTAEIFIVWRERLLARHRWSSPYGNWRVVVRSNEFEPVDTYDNVVQDDFFEEVTSRFADEVPTVLAAWRESVIRTGRLQGDAWEVYFESSILHGDVAEILLPAWRHVDDRWQAVLASLEDLGASARRNAVLRYVPPGVTPRYDPGDEELILQLPTSISAQLLRLGPLAGVTIVRADETTMDAELAAYRRNTRRPRQSFPSAVAYFQQEIDGFYVCTHLLPRDHGGPTHVVEIVWQGHVLERVEGPDIASFHTTIEGPQIGPDIQLRNVQQGRSEALVAAANNGRDTVVAACERLASGDQNDAARQVLLDIAASCDDHAGESWHDVLLNAPLLEALDGYESLAQREARIGRGTGDEILDEVIGLLREARGSDGDLVHEFTLAGFGWAPEDQQALCVADEMGVLVRRDHPLVQSIAQGNVRAIHFLASCVFTQINAYYQEISDANEIELQRRLLGVIA